jgi:hypothetical protein
MSVVASLQTFLQQFLPALHATRLRALMAAVAAGLNGAPISVTGLGRALLGHAEIKHKIKRMDRLVGNRQLVAELPGC